MKLQTTAAVILVMACLATNGEAQSALTLHDLVREALTNNLQLAVQARTVNEQSVAVRRRRADAAPALDLSGGYQDLAGSTILTSALDVSIDTSKVGAGLVRSQELLLDAARSHAHDVKAGVVLAVKSSYFRLSALRKEREALVESIAGLKRSLGITERLVHAGVSSQSALFQISDQVDGLQANLLSNKAAIRDELANLAQMLNREGSQPLLISDYSGELPTLPSIESVAAAVTANSPHLHELKLTARSLELAIPKPGTHYLPTLGVGVGYTQTVSPLASPEFDLHVTGTIRLLDFGKARYNREQNRAAYETMVAAERADTLSVLETVRATYDKAQLDRKLYSNYERMYASSHRALKLIETEYASGVVDEIVLIDAQKRTVDARVRLSGVFFDYLLQYSELQYYQGALQ